VLKATFNNISGHNIAEMLLVLVLNTNPSINNISVIQMYHGGKFYWKIIDNNNVFIHGTMND
jgi:hypothetical protein